MATSSVGTSSTSIALKVGIAAVAVAGGLILGLVMLAGGTGSSVAAQGAVAVSVLGQLQEEECVPTGPVPTLSAAQSSNAEADRGRGRDARGWRSRRADRADDGLHRVDPGEPRTRVGQ